MNVSLITRNMRIAAVALAMACVAVAPVAARADGTTQAYTIHPNDQLSVQVFGDSSLSQTVTVLPSGDISYPLVGDVHVAGESTQEAAATITAALKKYVRNPHVVVLVMQQGQINVMVLGGVNHQGNTQVPANSTFTDAIAAAGGLTGTATTYGDATVTDYAGNVQKVSLEKIFVEGDTSGNIRVGEGSTIVVPQPAVFDVEVSGAVDHPGEIELNEGDRLSMAIAKAGNSIQSDGDLNSVHVTRPMPNGQAESLSINLYQQLQQGNVSKDIVMQKGDIVFVPKSKHGLNGSNQGASDNPLYLLLLSARLIFPNI
jgi:polysaccharide export outer membrane protein